MNPTNVSPPSCPLPPPPAPHSPRFSTRYASINITKLDVLDDLDEVKIGVAYKINGETLPMGMMPSTLEQLEAVEVVYESMPGWNTSIAHCRHFDELPKEAQK